MKTLKALNLLRQHKEVWKQKFKFIFFVIVRDWGGKS